MEIHDAIYYDESSPTCLRWREGRWRNRPGGKLPGEDSVAGNVRKQGRYSSYNVFLFSKREKTGRVVWKLHHGEIAKGLVIDHIDGNALNNKISNLRAVTVSENTKNRGMEFSNTSGVTGVCLIKPCGRPMWKASWTDANGKERTKSFSVSKYGERAFELACNVRKEKMEFLKNMGMPYTARHGLKTNEREYENHHD